MLWELYDKLYWLPIVFAWSLWMMRNLVALGSAMVFDVQSILAITWWMCSIIVLACGFAMVLITAWISLEAIISWDFMPTKLSYRHRCIVEGKGICKAIFDQKQLHRFPFQCVMMNHDVARLIIFRDSRVIGVSLLVMLIVHGPIRSTHT